MATQNQDRHSFQSTLDDFLRISPRLRLTREVLVVPASPPKGQFPSLAVQTPIDPSAFT